MSILTVYVVSVAVLAALAVLVRAYLRSHPRRFNRAGDLGDTWERRGLPGQPGDQLTREFTALPASVTADRFLAAKGIGANEWVQLCPPGRSGNQEQW